MEQIIRIPIPEWAFKVALAICVSRQRHYRHQFICKKLKDVVKDDPILIKDVEGVYGYIGDICACKLLGLDPKEELRCMIVDTDLLTHRDEYNILYKGWRLDIKTEFYPEEKFERAIRRQLKMDETYGCRLINVTQFEENSATVDIYIFSTLDNMDPRLAKNWIPINWMTNKEAHEICSKPKNYTPSGARLYTRAYIFPNEKLRDISELLASPANTRKDIKISRSPDPERIKLLGEDKYKELIKKVGLE